MPAVVGRFRCSVPGCVYDATPETQNLMCPEHWALVPSFMQLRLSAAAGTQEWLRIARIATESVSQEVARQSFLEGISFREAVEACA